MHFQNSFTLLQPTEQLIKHHQLFEHGNTIIVGLSGGADSTCLLHLLATMRKEWDLTIIAAHLDHEVRSDSQKDVEFCVQLCKELNVPLEVCKRSSLAYQHKHNGSKEEVWRYERRFFLELVRAQHKADAIALAHHAQDQIETFFIRLMRGASLTGLTGMQPKDGYFIRPLLETSRTQIEAYLQKHALSHHHDPSNDQLDALRNRIRNIALPALRTCDDRFDANCAATMERLNNADQLLQTITTQTFARISSAHNGIAIEQLEQLPPALQHRVIMHWLCTEQVPFTPRQTFLEEILRFLFTAQQPSHHLHTAWHIYKKRGYAQIKKQTLS